MINHLDVIQLIIAAMCCGTGILIIIQLIRKKWGLTDITNCLTILGVIIAIMLLFNLSPQPVSIVPKSELKLQSFNAYEWVSDKDINYGLYKEFNIPRIFFSGYICNNGNAISSNLAFEFKFNAKQEISNINRDFNIYIMQGLDPKIQSVGNFDWGSEYGNVLMTQNGDWCRVLLPPIGQNQSVGIIVGYVYNYRLSNNRERGILESIVKDEITIRIIETERTAPEWKPNRDKSKYYSEKVLTEKKVLYSEVMSFKFRDSNLYPDDRGF